MHPARRRALALLAAAPWAVRAARAAQAGSEIRRGRVLAFPRDHGAHPGARTEWWYATGWLGTEAAPTHGFQLTFFRSRTGLAEASESRFAARQLLFAHAAVTQLADGTHRHAQRLARWNGRADAADRALEDRGDVRLADWRFHDEGAGWRAELPGKEAGLSLVLTRTQPLLLQGDAGFSRKGPLEQHASHYFSEPQLAASGSVTAAGRQSRGSGRAWLDHEWSDEYLAEGAAGWDWLGFNLFDGSALTAFVLRRQDGSALWAGGSFRPAGGAARAFGADEVRFEPGRRWRSPSTGASYPVNWQVQTPSGRFAVRALLDAQELDSRGNTGAVYWEGLSELLDAGGRRVGLGYLEMTGYAAALKM